MTYYFLIPLALIGYYVYKLEAPLDRNEKSITLYYWSQCGHCKAMMPGWNSMGHSYKSITIRKVERSNNTEYDVDGYPTIIYRYRDIEEIYQGGRDPQSIKAYLNSK